MRERRHVSDQRESGGMWIISDREQWVDHDVAESPQKAAEDMKAQEEPGQGSLFLQRDVLLPKQIKGATEEARRGTDNTYVTSGPMGSSTTQNLKSRKDNNLQSLCPTSLK